MKLDDLPRTVVLDGRRVTRRGKPAKRVVSYEDAHRDMLAQAQDVYMQALGALVMCANATTLAHAREIGRGFLRAAGAKVWTMPAGVRPSNSRRRVNRQ